MDKEKYCADLNHQQIRRSKRQMRDESRLKAFKERKTIERTEEFLDKRRLYSAINDFQFEHPNTIFNFNMNGLMEDNIIFKNDVEKFYSKVIALELADEDPELISRISAFLNYQDEEIYDEVEEVTLEYEDHFISISESNPDLAISTCNPKTEDYVATGLISVQHGYTTENKTTSVTELVNNLERLPDKVFNKIDSYLDCSDRLLLHTFGFKKKFRPCLKKSRKYVRLRTGYNKIAKRSKKRCCCTTIYWKDPSIITPWLFRQIRRIGKEKPIRAHTRLTFFNNVDHNFRTFD